MRPEAPPMGPWPVGDGIGFKTALAIIRASQEEGRNDKSYQQFDTIRKIRSAYSSMYESSPAIVHNGISFKGPRGNLVHFTESPLNSLLFRQFMQGLLKRMGQLVRQDLGLDVRILKWIMTEMDNDMRTGELTWEEKRHLAMCCGAFAVLYAGALQGSEVFLLEGSELVKQIRQGKGDPRGCHVIAPLMGRFKHETGERNLMFAFASVTDNSGLPIRTALERVVYILRREGRSHIVGPTLCETSGHVYSYWKVNAEFHKQLERVKLLEPELFGEDIDIESQFSLFRSFRRGATSRAREMKVPDPIINTNNRWRKSQNVAGGLPNLPMIDLYTEIQQALLTRLRFSRSL